MKRLCTFISLSILLVGCMNMPTPPSQITASYTSGIRYMDFDCDTLATEINSLARRENQLVTAQEQRINTSEMQAFWYGYGQGDGVEASELANVKGEKEAVRKAIEKKKCETARALLVKFDKEKAAKEEAEAFEKLVKREYQDCIDSIGLSSCSEEIIRKKLLSKMEKEKTVVSYTSLDPQAQKKETSHMTAENKENISKELLRKAKMCQSKGGVWITDQCILLID